MAATVNSVSTRSFRFFCIIFLVIASSLPNALVRVSFAQTQTVPLELAVVTERLPVLKSQIELSDLAAEQKSALLERLADIQKDVGDAMAKREAASRFEEERNSLPEVASDSRMKLESIDPDAKVTIENRPLKELESKLATTDTKVSAAKQAADDAEAKLLSIPDRQQAIAKALPEFRTRLEGLGPPSNSESTGMDLAEEISWIQEVASREMLDATVKSLQNESALLEAQVAAGVPQLVRDLRVAESSVLINQQKALQLAVEQARMRDAEKRVDSAEDDLLFLDPALEPIGQTNKYFAEENQSVAEDIQTADQRLAQEKAVLEKLRTSFSQAQSRVESIGLTGAVGAMLRNVKQNLPSPDAYRQRVADRVDKINVAQFELMDSTDLRNEDLDNLVALLIEQAPKRIENEDRFRVDARDELRKQRTDYLDPLIRNQTNYFNTLVSLSNTESQIVEVIEETRGFVDKHILWIRSSKSLLEEPKPARAEWWFLEAGAWNQVVPNLLLDVQRRLFLWITVTGCFSLLILLQMRLRRRIAALGDKVAQAKLTAFGPTFFTFLFTLAKASPILMVTWFVGLRLVRCGDTDQATIALGQALCAFGLTYFPFEFLRQLCRGNGLAQRHFEWPASPLKLVRQECRNAIYVIVPLTALTALLMGDGSGIDHDVLARYSFIALSLALHMVGRPFAESPFRSHRVVFANESAWLAE